MHPAAYHLCGLVSLGCPTLASRALCVWLQLEGVSSQMVTEGSAPAHTLFTPTPSEDMVDQLMGKDLVFSVNNYVTLQVGDCTPGGYLCWVTPLGHTSCCLGCRMFTHGRGVCVMFMLKISFYMGSQQLRVILDPKCKQGVGAMTRFAVAQHV